MRESMAGKYQVPGPDGKMLPPVDVDKLAVMAAVNLLQGDTELLDVENQRMVYADEVPGLKGKVAPGKRHSSSPYAPSSVGFDNPRAALRELAADRKRPPFVGIAFAVFALLAILNFAGFRPWSRARGTAAMVSGAGTPAVMTGGALAQSPEDLKAYGQPQSPPNKHVVSLPTNTRVSVLHRQGDVAQVRVTEAGANFNLTGYVSTANLRSESVPKKEKQ